ncbi:hypothetical protein N7520_007093 [Penicillium odoratum]|uniref:uncharacterized protein n=1 Tax=Penicillium odoratum TaxID=1167516 RepID=UPI002548FDA6|nr:uncharacterized protein N7520_007093 [Penicillium odoratum]KAJ5759937.1 hypothetical protein N7520_007093 [Penicillium odoratum]
MYTKECLPLVDLTAKLSPSIVSTLQLSLQQFGAFRLVAPQLTGNLSQRVMQDARGFFQLPIDVKSRSKGYSALGTELVLGRTAIPKESIYFFQNGGDDCTPPPSDLQNYIKEFHNEWTKFRNELFNTVSTILGSTVPLTGTPALDHETVAVNFYDSDNLSLEKAQFCPPHKDGGTLTILVRNSNAGDGLEIADLRSTEKLDSEGIGREASFISIPAVENEVIVLAGTGSQRLLGKDKIRACVHRVSRPVQTGAKQERLSLAIFCGPPIKSINS